jgi:hypothetical protein
MRRCQDPVDFYGWNDGTAQGGRARNLGFMTQPTGRHRYVIGPSDAMRTRRAVRRGILPAEHHQAARSSRSSRRFDPGEVLEAYFMRIATVVLRAPTMLKRLTLAAKASGSGTHNRAPHGRAARCMSRISATR